MRGLNSQSNLKLAIAVVLFCCSFLSMAQSNQQEIASLTQQLEEAYSAKDVEAFQRHLSVLIRKSTEQSVPFLQQGVDLAIALNSPELISKAYSQKASVFRKKGEFDIAIAALNEALQWSTQVDLALQGNTLISLGNTYIAMADYDQAIKSFHDAIGLLKNSGNAELHADAMNGLGVVYYHLDDLDKTVKYFIQALNSLDEKKHQVSMANLSNNIGVLYLNQGKFEESITYLQKTLALWQAMDRKKGIADTYTNFASVYFEMGKTDPFIEYSNLAKALYQELDDQSGIAYTLLNMGDYFSKIDDYEQAFQSYQQALEITESLNEIETSIDLLQKTSSMFEKQGDYAQALNFYKQFVRKNNEVHSKENQQKVLELESKYKSQEQQHQIELLEQKQSASEMTRNALIGGVLSLLLVVVILANRFRERMRRNALLRTQRQEAETMERIAYMLNAEHELHPVMEAILKEAITITPQAQHGGILLLNELKKQFEMEAIEGYSEEHLNVIIDQQRLLARYLKDNLDSDIVIHCDLAPMTTDKDVELTQAAATLVMPIKLSSQVIGFIVLDNMHDEHAFDHVDIDKLKRFKQHATSAFLNAHYTDKLEREKQQTEQALADLKKARDKLKIIAETDELTRLYNRRAMQVFLESAHNYIITHPNGIYSVILCDIDFFKKFNDNYGHECGDKVLAHVGTLLRKTLRKNDVVARWGGEEFLILLNGASEPQGFDVAEKLRKTIATTPYLFEQKEVNVTMSFGIARLDGELRIEQSIHRADMALYQGKERGRNVCVKASELD